MSDLKFLLNVLLIIELNLSFFLLFFLFFFFFFFFFLSFLKSVALDKINSFFGCFFNLLLLKIMLWSALPFNFIHFYLFVDG